MREQVPRRLPTALFDVSVSINSEVVRGLNQTESVDWFGNEWGMMETLSR